MRGVHPDPLLALLHEATPILDVNVNATGDSSSASASSSYGSEVGDSLLTCPTPLLELFNGFVIQEPSLIPTCILAAIIGFTGYAKIRSTNVVGHYSYAISFFLFGCMMSDAMFVHCFLYKQNLPGYLVEWIDVTLTSCVALSFGFNGLVDLGWIDETSKGTKRSMVLVYLLTGFGWYWTITQNSTEGFMFLYVGVIGISCGIYTVAEILSIFVRRGKGLGWLLLGTLFGGFGLYSIISQTFNLNLCIRLGANLGGEFLWFLLSDFAMYSLLRYFLANKGVTSTCLFSCSSSPYPGTVPAHHQQEQNVVYVTISQDVKTPPVLAPVNTDAKVPPQL